MCVVCLFCLFNCILAVQHINMNGKIACLYELTWACPLKLTHAWYTLIEAIPIIHLVQISIIPCSTIQGCRART